MKIQFLIVIAFFIFSGCTHIKLKKLTVVSEPAGADITMNGEYLGKAPVTKTIQCVCTNWCYEGHDWTWKPNAMQFVAMPNAATGSGEVQSSKFSPCLDNEESKTIFFNMKLVTQPHKNQIDVNLNKSKK